jgi:hypothetical protein
MNNLNRASLHPDKLTELENAVANEEAKSPEDRIRDYHEYCMKNAPNLDPAKINGDILCGVIQQTLDILDIKIEGVNTE